MYLLGQGVLMLNYDTIKVPEKLGERRKIIVENANYLDGLSAAKRPEDFRKALGVPPYESEWPINVPYSTKDGITRGISTCGLIQRYIYDRSGVADPRYNQPYIIGSAISQQINFAIEHKSFMYHPTDLYMIHPGDALILGSGGWDTHICVVISRVGDVIESIDGGQIDPIKGLQCVKRRRRKLPLEIYGLISVTNLPFHSVCWRPDSIRLFSGMRLLFNETITFSSALRSALRSL